MSGGIETNIIRKLNKFNYDTKNFTKIIDSHFLSNKFYIKLPDLDTINEEKVLLKIDGALCIRLIRRSFWDDCAEIGSLKSEGCFYFNKENERILEVEFTTYRLDKNSKMTLFLRLPLSAPFIKSGELGLSFDGVWLRFVNNGFVLNENSGYDIFLPDNSSVYLDSVMEKASVAEITDFKSTAVSIIDENTTSYISPYWWNANAGDVMNFYHDGVYHLLYLLDRRHHGSRNGCGAHYIAHITTSDFINWEEQEDSVPITKPWMAIGTGTMYFHNGKYYMSYGLHTERYTDEIVTSQFDDNSKSWTQLTFDEIFNAGKLPAGASYAVSNDGIHFEQSNVIFHAGRNPSMYVNKDNTLKLYTGYGTDGIWKSQTIDKPFVECEENCNFVSGSVMRNSTECPSFFEWNGYKYLVIGFTGFFRTEKNNDNYFDAAAKGEEIYDGLCVPMVTDFNNNRKIISGWLNGVGWGSIVVHRELIQNDSGVLGEKWIPEIVSGYKTYESNIVNLDNRYMMNNSDYTYLFEMSITPNSDDSISFFFSDVNSNGCELKLDLTDKKFQFNDSIREICGKKIDTMLDKMKKIDPAIRGYRDVIDRDIPLNSRNFALSNMPFDSSFELKIICTYCKKLNSTVIDVEIAGKRTAISLRKDLLVSSLIIKKQTADICDTKVYKVPNKENSVLELAVCGEQ